MGADKITTVPTGEKAIAACAEKPYDILFIDYNLGLGRNGRQLYAELQQRNLLPLNNISIIVTGESLSTMVVGALEVNPDDYIIKPFSQSLLKQRVTRLWRRKQLMLPIYQFVANEQHREALELIDAMIEKAPRLTVHCWRLKCDILFEQEEYGSLNTLLDQILKEKKFSWALIYKAKVLQQTNELAKSIAFAKEALKQSQLNVEAYDVLTDCYLNYKDLDTAYDWVQTGIEHSPFSVPRQYKLSMVAKLKEDYDASIKACQQVVDLTSTGFRKDVRHLLNHIRNIIDICDIVDDKSKQRRYNQEALYAIAESKQHAGYFQGMTSEQFEAVCMARLDSTNGHEFKAKNNFFKFAEKFIERGEPLPEHLMADSVALMFQIGEFDKAIEFAADIRTNKVELDEFSEQQLAHNHERAKDKMNSVKLLNKSGIEAFAENDYQKAYQLFGKALQLAPMNTGSAINQLQAIIEIAKSEPANRWKFVDAGRQVLKIIDGVPLSPSHKNRADALTEELDELESQRPKSKK